MKLYLIGTGLSPDTLTAEAAAAIRQSALLIGATRMLQPYADSGKQCVATYNSQEIAAILHDTDAACAAVLFSGDSGFFSGAKKLLPLIADLHPTVLAGISSVAAFCARIGISYEQMKFLSLHGKDSAAAIYAYRNRHCFFLLGGAVSAADLCRRLCNYGLQDLTVYIGENLGLEQEAVYHGKAADFLSHPAETLTVLVTENPQPVRYLPSAIPDDAFLRTKIPMTKAEIRCCAVSQLRIPEDAVCWDIGCGTGSVSVEMAYCCPDGAVYAFDRNPDAVRLTAQNAAKFHCDNIIAAEGCCPEILADAPAPDCVFVGGSSGNLDAMIAAACCKNPAVRIAVTAVSIETLTQAVDCFKSRAIPYSLSQIAVTRTKICGSHTMPDPLNPVYLLIGGNA